jgi:hypothetical protein
MTKIHNFHHYGVNVVKSLNTCVLDFYVMYVVWSEFMAVFVIFKFWICPGFIFEPCS